EARGQLDNTFVVVTSDNGYHLGQHRLPAGKFTADEQDVLVPLMVRGPGVARDVTRAHLIGQVDLAPTLAALGRARLPYAADCRSSARRLAAAPLRVSSWRRSTLLEQFGFHPAAVTAHGPLEPPEVASG